MTNVIKKAKDSEKHKREKGLVFYLLNRAIVKVQYKVMLKSIKHK